jgi:hypothetical protein
MTVAAMMLGTGNVSAWIRAGDRYQPHPAPAQSDQHLQDRGDRLRGQSAGRAEYVEQNTRWIRTLEQYRQALIQVQAAVNNFGMPDSAPLEPVAPNYLVAETCGKALDFSLESAFKVFVFNPQVI